VAFSIDTIKRAWLRAGGRCECKRVTCGHSSRCNKQLVWNNRGNDYARGGWEAHHRTAVSSGGDDSLSNCEILCTECHKNTHTYGHH